MFENIWKWLEDVMNTFKDFVLDHYENPLMWLGFFLLGILVFTLTYNALTKHKQ